MPYAVVFSGSECVTLSPGNLKTVQKKSMHFEGFADKTCEYYIKNHEYEF
jgi:hypothetical protein